jgi:magnesium transporter
VAQQGTALFLMDADGSLAETVDRAAIEQRLQSGACFWLDVRTPGEPEFAMLAELFGFHPLALEDSRAFGQRPKLDSYDGFAFMVVYGASPDEDGLVEAHVFYTDRYLVSIHHDVAPAFQHLREVAERRHKPFERSSVLLYRIVDSMTESFYPLLSDFDERIDDLEERTFASPDDSVLQAIFGLKRRLVGLRKVVTSQRDLFGSVSAGSEDLPGLTEEDERYFRDVYDHLIRISDLLDTYRDLVSSSMDVYLSSVSNRLSDVTKQLAIIATIFLPLSFIVGFFGQNFAWLVRNVPTAQDFWVYGIGSEIVAVVLLCVWFRRRGWI